MTTTATIADRQKDYGSFKENSDVIQGIKRAFRVNNWSSLDSDQKECLEMIAVKAGRILNGNPHHHDSWHDMACYAQLVADRIKNERDHE